jgi:hypothetical protein
MSFHPRRLAAIATVALVLPAATHAQLIPGFTSNFQNGTTQGWFTGGGPMGGGGIGPFNVAGGGRGGPLDSYMLMMAIGGSGSGNRLTASNASTLAGNYLAASIMGIGMWVNNFSATDLYLRLAFEDPDLSGGTPPTNLAFSTNAIFLAAGSGWTQVFFPTGLSHLTAGLGTTAAAMANVTFMRLYHSQSANFPNPVNPITPITAQLGVDDITATATPEPATLLLVGTGLVGLAGAARRRKRGTERT